MSEDDVKLLTIKHLQRNDTGAYICRVLNEYGFSDLIHYLHVLPGKFPSEENLDRTQRPNFLSSRLPDELILIIGCSIGLLLLAFLLFLIYHFRHEKTLRQTLLATRILATRGISNLKSVSSIVEAERRDESRCSEPIVSQRHRSENETSADRKYQPAVSNRRNDFLVDFFVLR